MQHALRFKLDHIAFWLFTIFFHGYTRQELISRVGLDQFVLELIWRNGLLALAIYLTMRYALPKLMTEGKRLRAILALVAALVCYVAGKTAHDYFLYETFLHEEVALAERAFYNFSIVLFYVAFATTLHLSKQWYLQRELMRKTEVDRLQTELQYLRAQMNPHFLFNSINTIYFQIDKHNTVARETLEKFADLLRYQLYECVDPKISIEKEIRYLKTYVQLQQLRLNDHCQLRFEVKSEFEGYYVPPLLLLPFVENAFKHVSQVVDRKNEIVIEVEQAEERLQLLVMNTYEKVAEQTESGGIGLSNVTRRLELIYGEDYQLEIRDEERKFIVNLQIPLWH